jgi:hypothetical protein
MLYRKSCASIVKEKKRENRRNPVLREPADDAVALAIEANNAFVARLEAIRAAADDTIDED